ncbi:unnamed protein product [Spirodela intermedia]|uniref:Coenzyme Q-binding protein COQ10 START domain-containing protein n=1 Tax=Spirodela intermedia TaxID=51605 RepID=A0A7I8KS71_SPIIN|nr:unnamed protein product [Spirodela intermedia]
MISASATARPLPHAILASHHHHPRQNPSFCFPSTSSPAGKILACAARASNGPHPPSSSEIPSSETAPLLPLDDEVDSASDQGNEDAESVDGLEVEVANAGRNRRRIQARISVDAALETVWAVLTDYEGLAEFIPGLAVCKLIEKSEGFARLYQVGQQDLALGLKFEAKATLDCFERDLEILPSGRRREIGFTMIEGDFQTFTGIWSILQADSGDGEEEEAVGPTRREFTTVLSYMVELEPKLWLPVRLLEGRIRREIKVNLQSIRERAQGIQRL